MTACPSQSLRVNSRAPTARRPRPPAARWSNCTDSHRRRLGRRCPLIIFDGFISRFARKTPDAKGTDNVSVVVFLFRESNSLRGGAGSVFAWKSGMPPEARNVLGFDLRTGDVHALFRIRNLLFFLNARETIDM